jgi:hypothetical protein
VIDTTKIKQGMVQASERTARRMTSRLRRDALSSGWPSSVSRHLTVVHESGQFNVRYPEHVADKVEHLEYGDQTAHPRPVIRAFRNRLGSNFDSEFSATLSRELRGVL